MFGTLKLQFLVWQLFGLLFPKFGQIFFQSSSHPGSIFSLLSVFMIESLQNFKKVKNIVLFDEMSRHQASQCKVEVEIFKA
jgi:hypothetical protein